MRWRMRLAALAWVATVTPGCIEGLDLGPSSLGGSGGYGGSSPYYDEDEAEWERREHQRYACSEIADRIDYDRAKIDEISATGRHLKALQWYRDDLRNAEREREKCREAGYTGWQQEKRERREDKQWQREEQERRRQEQARECDKMRERIRFDQSKVNEIAPTGRHKKALQWYKDDIANAQRYLQQKCH
jgi:hypothetical protein